MKTIPPPCPHPETGQKYWRSLDELSETSEFNEWLEREFPVGASEFSDSVSRRNFVKIMASSFALAGVGLTGCRRPVENIVPFTRMPEDYTHGVSRYYSTAMPTRVGAIPLVVKSHEGRPIKIEGNAEHPDSNGGTNTWAQASILSLYDVDRAKRCVRGGNTLPREAAFSYLSQVGQRFAGNGGAGLAFLLEPRLSPSRQRLQDFITGKFPQAKWYSHDPVDADIHERAATAALGRPVRPVYRFEGAAVIVSLDCDFIGSEEDNRRYITGFAKGRKIEKPADQLNRLYVVEPLMTLTGANSDHRLRVAGSGVAEKAAQLANAILNNAPASDKWVAECANDLKQPQNKGRVLVIAGHRQPLAVHVLALAVNEALGAMGKTVFFHEAPQRHEGTLNDLAQALNQGQVDTLVITGGNPVYTAPVDLAWAATQRKAREIIRLGYHEDETFKVSDLHLPETHYLESWGDARTTDGTYVPIQPLIEPLYEGITELEVLARVGGAPATRPHDIVLETFKSLVNNASDNDWKLFLHDGFLKGSAAQPISAPVTQQARAEALRNAAQPANVSRDNLEVAFHRDYSVDDGRYNNNGWLQEMPDPITKITWENVILVSQATAQQLGFRLEDFIFGSHPLTQKDHSRGVPTGRLSVGGKEITGPIWIQPGMADNVLGIALGYGREQTGRIGQGSGFNAYALRTSAAPYFALGGKLSNAGGFQPISCVQHHWAMEGRPIVREANYQQYQENPKFAKALDLEEPPVVESIYPNPLEREKNNKSIVHQWGMSIDLNSCVSCQACVIACQSENNVPIVGKQQVYRQREMHWLRLDRYYTGPVSDPQVAYQPMLCQHCEAAPCENVCPVNATTHDEEGLNLMVYNRCVGTRYCSNNCPYKVRRFNFFDYHKRTFKETTGPFYTTPLLKKTDGEWDITKWLNNRERHWRDDEEWELLKLVKNPEVTVRMRGVMEKCTFCIQRIEAGKISQKVKAGASDEVAVPDGMIKTACQQACPAEAIVFGNIKDPESRVSKLKALDR
ncbi:MAG TPA: TAT-variant-translocated molybdopterin oxidoreductase, partial [Verrucomicrobiae bacterium]|nr:TAT-variant-translocated molybdopterin oxidoreductase [Verrucomicrobiae bacterium]